MEEKQKAIQEAYGRFYQSIKKHIRNDGSLDEKIWKHNEIDLEFQDYSNGYIRPKSLQGIENNNGWIKIESEADLPSESDFYFGKDYEFGTDIMHFDFETKKWEDLNGYNQQVTHYQPIQKPKPPIY